MSQPSSAKGFSLIELLVVVTVLLIICVISIPYIFQYKKLYKSEDQALKIMDVMREANQLALNQRHTFRIELDLTDNAVLLIDEKNSAAGDLVKKIPIELPADVRIDTNPSGITPPNPPNYSKAVFANDTVGHNVGGSTVTGHSVWAARFRSDGSVVTSTNAPVSATIYLWPPLTPGNAAPRSKAEVRAITMYGGSGAIRYWKYNGTSFTAY